MESVTLQSIAQILQEVRANKPLVHHITNYVTVNDCANVTLAIGGSPIMADDIDEMEDIVSITSALVLNIGTLNHRTVESMLAAGRFANARHIPVILDPVGAGASTLRNETTRRLLEQVKIAVIRGNMSEIMFVAGLQSSTLGVDASDADMKGGIAKGIETAKVVALRLKCVTAITGATDIISDGRRTLTIENGSSLMSRITGTGCMCSSLVGSFCGASDDYLAAAAGGVLSMGIAGELAADVAGGKGNGSFRMAIIDAISQLDGDILSKRARLHEA